MNLLKQIEKHNLSIRRIPDKVFSTYHIQNKQEGDTIITYNGRQYCRRVSIPNHAGWYMVKQINNTDTTVRWSFKTDFLAKTLKESGELPPPKGGGFLHQ